MKDAGYGIPQEEMTKIGNPFFTTKETGTGLGLMVSMRIIQDHKGTMRVESEDGKGTMVEVILPIVKK
ncbi:ATP-binding protein [Paenibacillus aestuarii]|uniref:histidine kinase n=1 Tax=Paenibacillus aestuarii TaxID=516965 RepID=A0ABW0KH50_9BACL|nr:ATP-binding protein [Paenibacillus aestuarii]